ncbi:MAG: DUF2975 domain-containing protein [Firmicutes bacterium]|jgi:hypothetical protein|nr:DUF2975 domain-containing protein [Bacillota bacterium]
MNWNKDRSVLLSRVFICLFALSLLLIDVFGPKIIGWWVGIRLMQSPYIRTEFLISLYTISVLAWVCLWQLWKLLSNISRSEVFTEENIRLMRTVSWTLAIAAVISFASGFYYPPFFIAFAAAAFVMLIVRVVKNCFRQAVDMKDELDLTI